jgi:hypothetical protein
MLNCKSLIIALVGLTLLTTGCESPTAVKESAKSKLAAKQAAQYRERVRLAIARDNYLQQLEDYYTNRATLVADLAPQYRQKNRSSSCVHASTVMLLRWVGLFDMADWWWNTYSHGEDSKRHTARLEQAGLKFVVTTDGDERLLEWAIRSRRGCGVGWSTAHCVCLVGRGIAPPGSTFQRQDVSGQWCAIILDNNHIDHFIYQKWGDFLAEFHRQGGWAFAITEPFPPPAVPVRFNTKQAVLPRQLAQTYTEPRT